MAAQPLFVSSGDLVADRRYQWALDYLERGEAAAAADILKQVVETAPGFATAWFALASIREATARGEGRPARPRRQVLTRWHERATGGRHHCRRS